MNSLRTIQEQVVERLGNLSITARQAVESILTGQHRSVRRGLSVEFAGHREYLAGDDLRHLDWSVFARTDRFEVRLYEEETRLRATLVIDASGSMGYGSKGRSKLEHAVSLAAAMGFLMVRQSDAVGLATLDTAVRAHLPPRSTMGHYLNVLEALEKTSAGGETALAGVLAGLAGQLSRRGLVILLTDAFDDVEALVLALHQLRHRRQQVYLFQILDPAEETFPFQGMVEMVGLEGEPRLRLDGDRVRAFYQQTFQAHQRRLAEGCHVAGVPRWVCRTDEDLAKTLVRAFGDSRHV